MKAKASRVPSKKTVATKSTKSTTASKPKKAVSKKTSPTTVKKSVTAKKVSPKRSVARALKAAGDPTPSAASTNSTVPRTRKKATTPESSPVTDGAAIRKEASKQLAFAVVSAALDKKAERVEIIDISGRVDYTDFLVLMSGRIDRQVVAIAQAIEETVKSEKRKIIGMEGLPHGQWVIIDAGDVIAHVFVEDARRYYDLDGLWMDAPRVPPPAMTLPTRPG